MIKKRFISMLALLLMAVTGAMAEPITVTWTSSNGSFDNRVQYSGDGPLYSESSQEWVIYEEGTFTTNLGNFTQIQISGGYVDNYGADGWNDRTWTGNASSVYMNAFVTSDHGNDNFTITFTIEPPKVNVSGITLDKTTATLTLGETETVTLIPTVLPAEATDKSVTWSSSNEAVATVTDGVVTAVAAGEATITVTTTDGAKTATCAVTVAAPAASTYTVSLKEGTEDATSWTIAPAEATTTGVAAGTEVKATYSGTKKVKSVKAKKKAAAKEPATVTTAPTGAAIVGVGKSTELVSGGAADGGTLMYAVTTENTKPTSTDGFSDAVPTAKDITASGKVYVWYYVKGDGTHTDSEIAATAIEVPVADIVWDVTNASELGVAAPGQSYEIEGVTLIVNAEQIYAWWDDGISFSVNQSGGYTFTAPTGKAFTKIEMKAQASGGWIDANLGTGWAFNTGTVTWTGSAASTVGLLTDADDFVGEPVKSIAFYLSE